MSDTVTSKEALYMLDSDITQDMNAYRVEITKSVIRKINRHAELYKDVKFGKMGARKHDTAAIKKICRDYAKAHNDEFGEVLITELNEVDWDEVARRV